MISFLLFASSPSGTQKHLTVPHLEDSGVAEHGNGRAALPHERRGRGFRSERVTASYKLDWECCLGFAILSLWIVLNIRFLR